MVTSALAAQDQKSLIIHILYHFVVINTFIPQHLYGVYMILNLWVINYFMCRSSTDCGFMALNLIMSSPVRSPR